MDNKKWYKRISTCFWFMFATLPLWLVLIKYVFSWFVHTDGITSLQDFATLFQTNTLDNIFLEVTTYFYSAMPSWIRDMFDTLFTLISNSSISGTMGSWVLVFVSWFTWVYFLELLIDFIIWLPRFFHNVLSKGVDKVD